MRVAGCILAGGRSSRFGSDKALAMLASKTLLQHAIDRLAPQVAEIAVNTNSTDAPFTLTGLPLLQDATPDFRGPLAGILAALNWGRSVRADAVATVPVDAPLFPEKLVERLAEGGSGAICIGESATGLHPVAGLWPVSASDVLASWLASGQSLRVTDFLNAQGFKKVWFEAAEGIDPFFNVNFEGDIAILAAREQ